MKKQNKTNLRRLLGALTALLVVAGIAEASIGWAACGAGSPRRR